MILLWGAPGDDPLEAVHSELDRRRAEVTLLDQRQVLDQRVELTIGTSMGGSVWSRGRRFAFDEVSALYTRVYDARQMKHVAEAGAEAWVRVQEVESAIWSWADETTARVINRPTAMASNGSKPYQAQLIRSVGFDVPETLVTNDPELVRDFVARHGRVIYKSISGVRSIVEEVDDAALARLDDIRWCPVQFQAYVEGVDVRVHVVGRRVFATRIASDAADYRYAATRSGVPARLEATRLSDATEARCVELTARLGLRFSGIDLRITPDERVVCFEANPCPAYSYYEGHTNQPIARAVAHHLAGIAD